MSTTRVLIMGAAGRDFHNFNVCFRNIPQFEVVAFTAAQIPHIDGRLYPPELSGALYPNGIPIFPETDLPRLIRELRVDEVVFAYSDVAHLDVMHKASAVHAAGADFRLIGPARTQVKSSKPVVSILAVRTGAGKSQTARSVSGSLQTLGYRVVAVRHPMPYGDLAAEAVQRFAALEDLDRQQCTIEEREEYEPHIVRGVTVFAGVDYERILREAEKEADIVLWDGGNNDFSFYRSDLTIVVADPHRAGHELLYHPGETNLRMADVVVINKVETANRESIDVVRESVYAVNRSAVIIEAASPITIDDPMAIRGKRVLVVEDGPTLTHGGMRHGAGYLAARKYNCELVDPHPYAVGAIREAFERYRAVGPVLPAMGYGRQQMRDLQQTIARTPCDAVLIATPIDLRHVVQISQPCQRARYDLQEIGKPTLFDVLEEKIGFAPERVTQKLEYTAV